MLYATDMARKNFNSIKVRLEQAQKNLSQSFTLFQFHKGTIRTSQRQGAN